VYKLLDFLFGFFFLLRRRHLCLAGAEVTYVSSLHNLEAQICEELCGDCSFDDFIDLGVCHFGQLSWLVAHLHGNLGMGQHTAVDTKLGATYNYLYTNRGLQVLNFWFR